MTVQHMSNRTRKKSGPKKRRQKIQVNIDLDLLKQIKIDELDPAWSMLGNRGHRSSIINHYIRIGMIADGKIVLTPASK